MNSRQTIGAGILAAVVVVGGSVMLFGGHKEPAKAPPPKPVILHQDPSKPATQNAAPEWRTFVCTQSNRPLHYFKQAKAEFLDRVNGKVRWRVVTPDNSPQVLTVDPNNVICGYMNQ